MRMNNLYLRIYEFCTFPVAALGWLWYTLAETPFLQGRVKAYTLLMDVAKAADKENGEEE